MKLTKTQLFSFAGDIRPLAVLDCKGDVTWQVSDSSVLRLRELKEEGITDRVLVTLLQKGTATITAVCGNETAVCEVSVREAKELQEDEPLLHWCGDLHAHTSNFHNKDAFRAREEELPEDMVTQVREEGIFDFQIISDHAGLPDLAELYDIYRTSEACANDDFVVLPGAEAEVDIDSTDDYGFPQRSSGEVLSINMEGLCVTKSWEDFIEGINPSSFTIAGLAHPQIVGYSRYCMWGFRLAEQTIPGMKEILHFVEIGNGKDRQANLINERVYSTALDCGYVVAPSCGSDSHGPVWGASFMPGRTIILAPEKSKERFLDAIKHARMYATENGNVKLDYTVNGGRVGDTLPLTDRYEFRIQIEPFSYPSEKTAYIEIFSDYGKKVAETTVDDDTVDVTMTVYSKTARYFYLRIISESGARTWSSPIWTGRAFDECPLPPFEGVRLEKSGWTITEGAEDCINGDPDKVWKSSGTSAVLDIDMGEEKLLCGFGYYPHRIERKKAMMYAQFAGDYVYSVSEDGEQYTVVAEGAFREYCGEQIVRIAPVQARYVRISILNTSGVCSRKPRYINEPLVIGELNIYEQPK